MSSLCADHCGGCAGKVNKHIDLWDAVRNNKWFSLEAVSHVGSQMGSLMRVPDLESFQYTVLRKTKDYEIRRCVRNAELVCGLSELQHNIQVQQL